MRLNSTDRIDRELPSVSWQSTPPLPHLWELWALEAPVGALHKTTYALVIYTALCVMFLMCADPLLGPQAALTHRFDAISPSPKKFRFPGPNPLPLVLVTDWICTHPKRYARGCVNHRYINSYYVPYSFLLISSKFCNGRSSAVMLLYRTGRAGGGVHFGKVRPNF